MRLKYQPQGKFIFEQLITNFAVFFRNDSAYEKKYRTLLTKIGTISFITLLQPKKKFFMPVS